MSQYSTGTVTVTGNNIVTGAGTSWLSDPDVVSGSRFQVAGDNATVAIQSVDSETQITLAVNYTATTGSGLSYVINNDFTPNLGLGYISANDAETHVIHNEAMAELDGRLGEATSSEFGVVKVTSSPTDTTAGRVTKVGDFGLGGSGNFSPIYNNTGQGGALYSVGNDPDGIALYSAAVNLPYNNTYSAQIGVRVAQGLGEPPSVFVRSRNGSGAVGYEWSPTVELYHTGNLNVNEFGGGRTNGVVAVGEYRTIAPRALFYIPLASRVLPASITVSGSFYVRNADGNILATAQSGFALTDISSERYAVISIDVPGGTAGEQLTLAAESATSKITVNF